MPPHVWTQFLQYRRLTRRPPVRKVSLQALMTFYHCLEHLLQAKVSLADSLKLAEGLVEEKALVTVVAQVRALLLQGRTLAQSMEAFPKVFTGLSRALIEMAEETGDLATMMGVLKQDLQGIQTLRQQVGQVVLYPLCVLGAISVMMGLLMGYVLPSLLPFLQDLNEELPTATRWLLAVQGGVQQGGIPCLLGIGVVGLLIKVGIRRSPRLAYGWGRVRYHLPWVGPLQREGDLLRCYGLWHLLAAQRVSLRKSLEILRPIFPNMYVQENLRLVWQEVVWGHPLSRAWRHMGTPLGSHLLQLSEQTGDLTGSLAYLRTFHYQQWMRKTQRLLALLQPLLLLLLSGVLLSLAMAVLGPVYQSLGGRSL